MNKKQLLLFCRTVEKMQNNIFILIIPVLLFTAPIFAQSKIILSLEFETKVLPFGFEEKTLKIKPKIGLALSGGGARGISQIGVLKAFEEEKIHPDIIVGTSMGSIIGGFYASGYSIEELDSIANKTDWRDLLSITDEISRRELFIDQKAMEDRSIFTLRLDGLKPVLPTSFNDGTKLSNYLSLLAFSAPVRTEKSFDELMINYRAVCADLVNGEIIILDHGPLGRAMRASSSVSFLLSPVEWDGLALVDGGLVANIPVDATRKTGADIVIAVNTASDLHKDKDLGTPWLIADQTVSIPMMQLNKTQLQLADVVIEPELENKTSSDFSEIDSLILLGYQSAKQKISEIRSVIDSCIEQELNKSNLEFLNVVFDEGPTNLDIPDLNKYIDKGSTSRAEILKDIYFLYESGRFEDIHAEVTVDNESSSLKFIYKLKPIIKSINFVGIGVAQDSACSDYFDGLVGFSYNSKTIVEKIAKALGTYRKHGYLLSEFSDSDFNRDSGNLTVRFKQETVSKIILNTHSNSTIILREFNIEEGDRFLYNDVKTGLDNLRSSGLFSDLNLRITDSDSGKVVYLDVEERESQLLRAGFKADNVYNAQFSLDIRDINIFGTGNEAGIILFGGTRNRAYIAEHIAHRIFDTYLTYKINAYYKFNDINTYRRTNSESGKTYTSEKTGEYRQIFYGASLSLGSQIQKFGKMIFTGKYQLDEVKNKTGDVADPYKTKIVGLRIGATIDNQNKFPYPDDGLYFNGYYETAQSFLGGDEGYIMVGADFKYSFNLVNRSVLIPKIQIGFADQTLPLSEQFTLGGQYSFFGMHENEFRGRQIFLLSLTYQYKLPINIFFDTYFSFRYDLGSTWEQQEQIRFKDLKHGLGGTISFDTPIGPADFSIGRSFLLRQQAGGQTVSWGDVLFYFSIGYPINF